MNSCMRNFKMSCVRRNNKCMHNRMKKFKISYMKIFKKGCVIEELQKKLHQLKKQYIVRNSQAKLSQKKQGNDLR